MTHLEDEIDIRPYLQLLIVNWWKIALTAGIVGILTIVILLLLPDLYEAQATILVTRSRTTLSLAEQFPTIIEPIDARSRMDALVTIASSDSITLETFQSLQDHLPENYKNLDVFHDLVQFETTGDILQLSCTAEDPNLAALIANEWANHAVNAINLGYSGEQSLTDIQAQLSLTREEYNQAQNSLEAFLAINKISYIQTQLDEASTVLVTLADNRAQKISYYNDRVVLLNSFLIETEAVLEQINNGSLSIPGDSGDALVVLLARASLLSPRSQTSGNPSPPTIELQLNQLSELQDSSSNYSADLESLIDQTKKEIIKAEEMLAQLSEEINLQPIPSELDQLLDQIRQLETSLEAEQAILTELTTSRDLAWMAFQALSEKEIEIRNALQTDTLVRLASPAVPPVDRTSNGTIIYTLSAFGLGAFIAICWLLIMKWWRS